MSKQPNAGRAQIRHAMRSDFAEAQNRFPHLCRDGHQEIGHRDSEHELCPMCRVINQRGDLLSALVDVLEYMPTVTAYQRERVRKAEAAIAKAEA